MLMKHLALRLARVAILPRATAIVGIEPVNGGV